MGKESYWRFIRFNNAISEVAAAAAKPEGTTKKGFFNAINESLDPVTKFLINFLAILIGITLLFYAGKEIITKTVIVSAYDVPDDFKKSGYSGKVFAQKLYDQLDSINQKAVLPNFGFIIPNKGDNDNRPLITEGEKPKIEVELHGTGISIGTAIEAIRNFFNIESTKVSGRVYKMDKRIYINVHLTGNKSFTVSAPGSKIDGIPESRMDSMIKILAEYVETGIAPKTMLQSYINSDDDAQHLKGLKLIHYLLLQTRCKADSSKLYNAWGYLLDINGEYQNAVSKYKKAIALNKNAESYFLWAESARSNFDLKKALPLYTKAIALEPSVERYCGYGAALLERNDTIGAKRQFNFALALNSNASEAYKLMGDLYFKEGKYELASEKYNEVIDRDPDYIGAYFELNRASLRLNDTSRLAEVFQKVLTVSKDPLRSYLLMGNAFFNDTAYSRASAIYKKALIIDPTYNTFYYQLASSLAHSKNKADSVEAECWFKDALISLPNFSGDIYNNRGDMYHGWNNDVAAIKMHNLGITEDPHNPDNYEGLMKAYARRDGVDKGGFYRMKQIAETYIKWHESNPGRGQIDGQYGYMWFKNKNYDRAIAYINKALDNEPENDEYKGYLQLALDEKYHYNPMYLQVYYLYPSNLYFQRMHERKD